MTTPAPTRPPFVDQTILYDPAEGSEKGNCTEAAVASILGLRLEDVPDFRAEGLDRFWDAFDEFFHAHGFHPVLLPGHCAPDADVLYLASGLSPRGVHHMVVMRGGKLAHDPHPSKAGIGHVEHIWLIVPIDPAACGATFRYTPLGREAKR